MIEKFTTEDFDVKRDPALYYRFLDIAKSVDESQIIAHSGIKDSIRKEITVLQKKSNILQEAANNFMQEAQQSVKLNKKPIISLDKEDDSAIKFNNENFNFIVLVSQMVGSVANLYEEIYALISKLTPPSTMTINKRSESIDNLNQFMAMQAEIQLNGGVLEKYITNIAIVYNNTDVAGSAAEKLYKVLESYYRMLLNRHTAEGVKIHKDAIITDVAIRIFENIDSHGEIDSGKDANQVSAYTIRKAHALTMALKDDMMHGFLSNPDTIFDFITDSLTFIEKYTNQAAEIFKPQMDEILRSFSRGDHPMPQSTLNHMLSKIKTVNPLNISYQEPKTVKSESEALVDNVRNETIEGLANMILDPKAGFEALVGYVLERKIQLKKYFHEENSFYKCKIGDGNPFTGVAPGALEVIPAERPRGNIDKILGSGFDEVREFAESIKSSAKWHDLFMATSPSGSTDKSNILLIGPQGCGKTEVMRAIGASTDSIGIFAQGSDFNTCWKGEAEKNPKRLFEEGVKLNRESNKHVHFLIDEIDAILNNDRDMSGGGNLTLEFQILMDGVISYPNLSVWGATNNPERIPMPMIRRFNKVLIVGELSQDDRVKLLKQFLNYMPLNKIDDIKWEEWGRMLEGATGDVVRKIADYIWRKKMNRFVLDKPEDAESVVTYLNSNGKFSIDKFDRDEFKSVLGKCFMVSAKDIHSSIEENLSNMAVRSEIDAAVKTYERARSFIKQINNKHEPAL